MEGALLVSAVAGDAVARTPRELLAAACRILAHQGHAVSLAGQITMRDRQPTTGDRMWTLPLGVGLDEATAAQVLLVDTDLNTVEGQGRANPAVRFHDWIYRVRPDIQAIIHTHPPALSAFSTLGQPLPVAHMDAAMFHDDCGFLARWPGVPVGDEEGELIAGALRQYRCAMLTNHGAVCTGASLAEATYLAVFAERNARMCLEALAAGRIAAVEPEAARVAHDFLLQQSIVDGTFAYWARQAERANPTGTG